MPNYTFPRTGRTALSCSGEIVARATSQAPGEQRRNQSYLSQRWHELTLVRTERGYVLAIAYRHAPDWSREVEHDHAEFCEDESAVPPALEAYDPIEHVHGYPPGAQFAERQQRLLSDLQRGYYSACGRLLAEAGIAERV